MTSQKDISWKDFLAGILGYFVSIFCVGLLFLTIGTIAGKIGDETVFVRHEFLIACATFLSFSVGGLVMGMLRPHVAIRNGIVLFSCMMLVGLWRTKIGVFSAGDAMIAAVQVSGIIFGAWFFERLHSKGYLRKK